MKPGNYGLIGYLVKNTITENGSVKRGVCKVDDNGKLLRLDESKVERIADGRIMASPLCGDDTFEVAEDDTVSMNMLCFDTSIFDHIEENFPVFFENNKNNLEECEYLIPILLFDLIRDNKVTTEVVKTTATWYGVTYKEDAESVKAALKEMVDNGVYPNNLWEEE